MIIKDIAKELGIEKYPPLLEDIFTNAETSLLSDDLLEPDYIRGIIDKHNILSDHREELIQLALAMKEDRNALIWLNICNKYLDFADGDAEKGKLLPMPKVAKDESTVDIFPILLLLPQIGKAKERYIKRGLTDEEASKQILTFDSMFRKKKRSCGRLGLTPGHYLWLCNYIAARILLISGFNFEVKKFQFNGVYIKNKFDGCVKALMLNEKIHKSGLVLGTPGCKDEEGSWFASYTETDSEFIGFAVDEKGFAINEKLHFSKKDWEKILEKGDDCISFHIPSGANFTPENLEKSFKDGVLAVRKYFPDQNIRCITCASWLVSPQLQDLMKPTSNVVSFAKRFIPLPQINSADSAFSCIFPGKVENYNDLPEKTSLQKSIKQLYLDGGYLYTYIGAFEIKD